jgi:hypothetical protein
MNAPAQCKEILQLVTFTFTLAFFSILKSDLLQNFLISYLKVQNGPVVYLKIYQQLEANKQQTQQYTIHNNQFHI